MIFLIKRLKLILKPKVIDIKYMILFEKTVHNYPYNFYESFKDAETKRLTMTKTEGKVVKVIIEKIN